MPKDNEAATWREKLDQLYKSSSQSFRVVVHGSKVRVILLSFVLYLVLHKFHDIFVMWRCDFLKEN